LKHGTYIYAKLNNMVYSTCLTLMKEINIQNDEIPCMTKQLVHNSENKDG
jgi:hypothetical protein